MAPDRPGRRRAVDTESPARTLRVRMLAVPGTWVDALLHEQSPSRYRQHSEHATLRPMGYPRRLQVPPDTAGIYHCTSRCVRRAFLCGEDSLTGRSFEHRKQWLEERILKLAEIFAVAVHAYAIMSNHFHVVLETDPDVPRTWSDEKTARRWLALCSSDPESGETLDARVAALVARPERLAELRTRLGSLSWFMRYLKEPIARRANHEDGCTGRFWEGRFHTQALLDDPALLACMVYVDLNPFRAGSVATPEDGPHTSLRRRTRAHAPRHRRLTPLATSIDAQVLPITTAQYLQLVDWTGRTLHSAMPDAVPARAPPLLEKLSLRPRQWLIQVPATQSHYWRAIGCVDAMIAHARTCGRKWLRGIGTARTLQQLGHSP
jgi:hypothetical protein